MNPFLKAENISKVFPNGADPLVVLDGIQLEFHRGESCAVVGPSGSGKSTLLGILAGLERPSEGRVILFGRDLQTFEEKELSRMWGNKIGFIFQSYRLLQTMTALENTLVPLELAGEKNPEVKARYWIQKVGLTDRWDHLPRQLSGGEQQRVALARALATGPEILFADEPTGNLDSKTGGEMADLLFSLVRERGTTLILITHEPTLASRAGRVIEIDGGKVVGDRKT